MSILSFRDLKVWQIGKTLAIIVYRKTDNFPIEERYELISQMRRSAISIPSNIAEGYNRSYIKEYQRFLHVALGSCAELETQLEISRDLNYVDESDYNEILEFIDHESRMFNKLITKLKECK